jgi:hypothetical protein
MTASTNNTDKIVSLAFSQRQKIATGEDTSNSCQLIDFKLAKMLTDLLSRSFLFEICAHCSQPSHLHPHCDRAFTDVEFFPGHRNECNGAN